MEVENESPAHLRLFYVLTTIFLFIPVVSWPFSILWSGGIMSSQIQGIWLVHITILIMVSVAFDCFLYGAKNRQMAINSTLWITIYAIISASLLSQGGSAILFAALFFIHSFRSGYRLFITPSLNWWLWPAWTRDVCAAQTILLFYAMG